MPSPPSSPTNNSLLNFLNPYASVTASQAPRRRPSDSPSDRDRDNDRDNDHDDGEGSSAGPSVPLSPSAVLLRELQFQSTPGGSTQSPGQPPTSPTPTPKTRASMSARPVVGFPSSSSSSGISPMRPSHILAESSSDDDGPPQSLMFHATGPSGEGGSTPTSHSPGYAGAGVVGLGASARWKKPAQGPGSKPVSRSPGPFRRRPSSTSSSTQSPTSPLPRFDATQIPDVPAGPYSRSTTTTESDSGRHSPTPTSPSTESEPPTARPVRPWVQAAQGMGMGGGIGLGIQAGPRDAAAERRQIEGPARSETPPTPGPSRTRRQGKHKYHAVPSAPADGRQQARQVPGLDLKKAGLSGYNKALWKWVNVTDLDSFLQKVYIYYEGKGLWCIALRRALKLLTRFFVIGFTTFLTSCIDYSKLAHSVAGPNDVGRLDDALVPKCLTRGSFWHMLLMLIVVAVYIFELAAFIMSIPELLDMYRFYTYLLGVPDTMPWPEIVRLIGDIKKHNPVTSLSNGGPLADMMEGTVAAESPKLDAHDIANRILRQDNYLTALYSRDLLDLRVRFPLPKAVEHLVPPSLVTGAPGALPRSRGDQRQFLTFGGSALTRTLELNLNFCVMGCLFDHNGQVRKETLRERNRKDLVEHLRRRFIFMGLINAVLAPFIVVWVLIYSFFRYFDEYHKNPSNIGSRKYTRYAEWKFREFNELPHLLDRRLKQSYPVAKEYIDQFPKERTSLVMRFVSFIAGSFAAVLLAASLIDPDLFLHFEITPHRTVLFYLGVFGSILAIARGMVPEENLVFDPEYLMRELVRYTHYLPPEWKGKLHSQKVHADFGQLFQMKVAIFAQELISVLLTPFILWFSLPDCSGAIIDFFREFTVHVEGIGYVCSFAVFDFERPGAVGAEGAAAAAAAATTADAPPSPIIRMRGRLPLPPPTVVAAAGGGPKGKAGLKKLPKDTAPGGWYENKMEQSFLHFKAAHPDWQPTDPGASVFLDRLIANDASSQQAHHPHPYRSGMGLGLGQSPGLLPPGGHRPLLSPAGEEARTPTTTRNPHAPPHAHAGGAGSAAPGSRWFQPAADAPLPTMDEYGVEDEEDEDDDEAEAMGWNRRIVDSTGSGSGSRSGEGGRGDRGLLREGARLLDQVMNR